ncbi:MAG: helix-turn-helix transcriptional regulator [Pseudomonadota bacterium]
MDVSPRVSELNDAVDALAALAQVHRLAVFRQLVQAGSDGLAAGVLAERMAVPRSSLSFHLSNLKHVGLVHERRQGRSIVYSANFQAMRRLIAYLLMNCCAGEGAETALAQELFNGEHQ